MHAAPIGVEYLWRCSRRSHSCRSSRRRRSRSRSRCSRSTSSARSRIRATRTSTTPRWCSSASTIATVEGVARLPTLTGPSSAGRCGARDVARSRPSRGDRHRSACSTAAVGGRCRPTPLQAVNDAAIREVPANARGQRVVRRTSRTSRTATKVVRVPGAVARHQLGCARRAPRRSESRAVDRGRSATARCRR